ncbi:MAG: hypothetical protein IV090_13680 [Candidatus Sericytochromatia bacterium]|nr:hypothetical protein [Candidatus Sericytochromatia bacterium]
MQTSQTVYLRKSTHPTGMLRSSPIDQILFFVRRFIQNVDWVYDLLSLTDKLIHQNADFSKFERLIIEDYLHMSLRQTRQGPVLFDRFGTPLDITDLMVLRDEVIELADKHALYLFHNPRKHPLSRAFKQVLAKDDYDQLNEEAHALLREAYLTVKNGQIYTLRGRLLGTPSWTQRWMWKLIS